MWQFLAKEKDGQKAQDARNVVVFYAVKKDLTIEAEAAVADYKSHQPQNPRSVQDERSQMRIHGRTRLTK
jgi:hypothetical protein